jgi:hypothetical protein
MQAKNSLVALIAEIGATPSKDRPFVIRLLAQIDEMLEELNQPYHRYNSVSAGIVPRMVSNQVALGVQRGIVSRLHSVQPDYSGPTHSRSVTGVLDTFSSPAQREVSAQMSENYSRQTEDNDIQYAQNIDPDYVHEMPPPPVPIGRSPLRQTIRRS